MMKVQCNQLPYLHYVNIRYWHYVNARKRGEIKHKTYLRFTSNKQTQTLHFNRHHQGALLSISILILSVILYRIIANNSKIIGSENYSFIRSIWYQTNLVRLFEKITKQLTIDWFIKRNWKSNQTFISDLFFLLWHQMLQGLKLV